MTPARASTSTARTTCGRSPAPSTPSPRPSPLSNAPTAVSLALCQSVDRVRGDSGISLEPKFDGWRCQVLTGAGRVWSRHGTDLTRAFADIAQAPRAQPDCVLDGELVAVLDSRD
ncbi:hypothetical protein [Streptomyces sp. NBC_00554]|uniref:ATP-dependent DNA ligase n=1 Tax=Streptomyces sp. NBC_00554 TaxID=2903661 RepID=UPI00352F03BF